MSLQQIPVKKFNPYNELGIIHNNALDYFVNNVPDNYTLDDVLKLSCTSVLDDMKGRGNYNNEDVIRLQGIAGSGFNTMYLPPRVDTNFIPINVEAIIKHGNFNDLQSEFVKMLLNPSTELSVLEYRSVVISIESNVLNSSLSCSEQFPLLGATAVGKATTIYWNDQIIDPDSPWNAVLKEEGKPKKPWWGYVLADLAGALEGFSGGAIGMACGAAGGTIGYVIS